MDAREAIAPTSRPLHSPAPLWRLRSLCSLAIAIALTCMLIFSWSSLGVCWIGFLIFQACLFFVGFGIGIALSCRMPRQWETALQTLSSSTAISFRPSTERWKSYRKAQWGICGRETCSALKWFGLVEVVVAFAAVILGLGIGFVEGAHSDDMSDYLKVLVPGFISVVVEFRLWWLWQCSWNSLLYAPPIIILNCSTSAIHFLQLHINVSTSATVLESADGKVLVFEFCGIDEPVYRIIPRSFYQIHVPMDPDFDFDTISRCGFRLH